MKRSIAAWLERRLAGSALPAPADPSAPSSLPDVPDAPDVPAATAQPAPSSAPLVQPSSLPWSRGLPDSRDDVLCALPEPLPWPPSSRVLVFAPHPDDEAMGCGGLLVRLVQANAAVRVVLVTDGSGAGGLPPGAALVRQREFVASLARLGITDHAMLGFPDGELLATAPLFEAVAAQVRSFQPQWVVGPSAADAHRDHRCTAHAVRHAALACACVQMRLEYESWCALPATHVLDITDQLATKLAALAEHTTALAQMDYASATEGLARYRGLLLRDKRDQAAGEAFVCTRRETGFAWPAQWGRPVS